MSPTSYRAAPLRTKKLCDYNSRVKPYLRIDSCEKCNAPRQRTPGTSLRDLEIPFLPVGQRRAQPRLHRTAAVASTRRVRPSIGELPIDDPCCFVAGCQEPSWWTYCSCNPHRGDAPQDSPERRPLHKADRPQYGELRRSSHAPQSSNQWHSTHYQPYAREREPSSVWTKHVSVPINGIAATDRF